MAYKNPVTDEAEESESKVDPLAEIREKFSRASEYWEDDRRAALNDIKFRAGDQWPEAIRAAREQDKRPVLTLDKLSQYVRQIVNDGRQNRPSIKVRPVDSGADIATAEVYQGLIRHIEDHSNADAAYDTALDSSATCGQGYFRVLTEYIGDNSFDQEIVIRRIRNPLNVIIDPDSKEADGSDMRFCFVIDNVSMDEFEAMYPGVKPDDWESNDSYSEWFGNHVRIAEYWCVEEIDRKLHLLQDGSIIDDTRLSELKNAGIDVDSEIKESRNIPKRVVKYSKVCGSRYLEKPRDWAGKWIPVFPVWGNESDIEGKVTHSGIIRPGKDPQRLYNYSRSAFAERVALTPKAPWVAAEGQIEDYENEWATANVESHSVLRYKPVTLNGSLVPPPQRQTAADIPAGFAQDMQISEHDIQAAIGMYAASLGAPSNERSGKAIMARQREGDVGTFHYHDNLNRSIRHCGRVLVDLIPKIYDTTRIIRILGYDGTPNEVQIDPSMSRSSQRDGLSTVYNLGVGRYDVAISTGPSYTTLRQEAASSMLEMVQANPELMGVIGDLLVKNMDWPGAEEISERLKLTLPPEIQQAEQSKKQKGMSPEMQQIVAQFEKAVQQKDELMGQAAEQIEQLQRELQKLKTDNDAKKDEVIIKAADSETRMYQAETQRMQVLQQQMTPEQIQSIVVQTLIDLTNSNTVDLNSDKETANVAPEATEQSIMEQPNV